MSDKRAKREAADWRREVKSSAGRSGMTAWCELGRRSCTDGMCFVCRELS